MPAALSAVAARPEVISSLLTGNCAENARTKLGVFGLDSAVDLEVGGYGSDALVRGELVAIAQAKAASRDGFDPGRDVTVLVGDTPLDVEAGLTGGAYAIGVGTGRFTPSELRSAGADEAVADLADLDGFLAALGRLRGRGPVGRGRSAPDPCPGNRRRREARRHR